MTKTNKIENFSPGESRILTDFQVLLNYVIEDKPIVSRKVNRVSGKAVLELNQKLSKSLNLDLKQHNQTSY